MHYKNTHSTGLADEEKQIPQTDRHDPARNRGLVPEMLHHTAGMHSEPSGPELLHT